MSSTDLKTEWCLQQTQYDSYEKFSLCIKLTAIVIASLAIILGSPGSFAAIMVLWVLDAIWKTFQSRIEARLLVLEGALSAGA
ncbi:MAG: hypothetical protein AAF404_18935, partial [Pseudomonadota bacterium]